MSGEKPLLPMTEAELDRYRLHRRFDRLGRLVGDAAVEKLMRSAVTVVGLGGVGSWTAEALARSAIGRLTLVDFDEICVTNANRQLPALAANTGQLKAEVLAERLRQINPKLQLRVVAKFYEAETSDEILFGDPAFRPDFVVDAIDNVTAKCHLIQRCRAEGVRLVSSTGSGGRLDPTAVRLGDLADTQRDPLAKAIRRILRQHYGFPMEGAFGIPAVFSTEQPRVPEELHYDGGKGFRCVCPHGGNSKHACENRNVILGTACFVTSAFGMACASVVVRELTEV